MLFYSYLHNSIGKRNSFGKNGATTLYVANELNQYTNALAGGRTITYDPDGNMTSDGTWSYAWDAENRLVGVSPRVLITGSRTYSYEYDHMGRRVKKIEKRHAMAESDWGVHTFDYDAWNLLRERIQSADAMTTNQYTWGIDLSGTLAGAGGIGGLLAATLDGTNAFYTCDANGNITDLLAEDGALLAHYAYAPYGTPTAQSGPLATSNPFRFSTKYHDNETGLYYYGYRYYAPVLSCWASRDPLEEQGGRNLYVFCNNRPIDSCDSDGRWAFVDNAIAAIAGALVGLGNQAISDLILQEASGWEAYVGAAVAGAIMGEILLHNPAMSIMENSIYSGISVGVGNLIKQGCEWYTSSETKAFDTRELAIETAAGAILALLPFGKINGVNRGRGSYLSVARGMDTKFRTHAISRVEPRTTLKSLVGTATEYGLPYGLLQPLATDTLEQGVCLFPGQNASSAFFPSDIYFYQEALYIEVSDSCGNRVEIYYYRQAIFHAP